MNKSKDILRTTVTLLMLVSTYLLYDNEKPVLDYMEYLPVYRVEQLWERRDAQTGDDDQIRTENALN